MDDRISLILDEGIAFTVDLPVQAWNPRRRADSLPVAWNCLVQSVRERQRRKPWRVKEAIGLILEVLREDLESQSCGKAEVFKVELADVC